MTHKQQTPPKQGLVRHRGERTAAFACLGGQGLLTANRSLCHSLKCEQQTGGKILTTAKILRKCKNMAQPHLFLTRSVQNLTVISANAWTDVLFVPKAVEVKPQTAPEVLKALQGDDTLQGGMMPSQLTAMMIGCPEAIRWLQKANDLTRLIAGLGQLYPKTATSPESK